MEIAQETLNGVYDDTELMNCIMTRDEKWIYGCGKIYLSQ